MLHWAAVTDPCLLFQGTLVIGSSNGRATCPDGCRFLALKSLTAANVAALMSKLEGITEVRMAIVHLNANSLLPCRPVKYGHKWHVHRSTVAPDYKDLNSLAGQYKPIFR